MSKNTKDLQHFPEIYVQAADIREQRNQTSSRLYQLPDELVENILLCLFHDQLRQWRECNQSLPIQLAGRIHEFTFCRRIRGVALCTPEIWTFIPLCTGEERLGRWADLCLQRTADYPLTLYIWLSSSEDRATMDKAIMLSSRTRNLQLVVKGDLTNGLIPPSPAGILLDILYHRKWPILASASVKLHGPVGTLHLSSELLGEASSKLVILEMQGLISINVEASHRPFSCLEHIVIRTLHLPWSFQWQEWLSKLPALQSIDITFYDRVNSIESPLASFQANLPHLRSVKLSGNARRLLLFLSSLPDPLERLSLSISTLSDSLPGINEAEKALTEYIMATWKRRTEREWNLHDYKLTLDHLDLVSSSNYTFAPIASASDHDHQYRIDVKGNIADKDTIKCLAQVASTLEILPGVAPIPDRTLINALQSPTSIHTLKLHAWDTLWATAGKIPSLEMILRELRQNLCPLKTLIIDAPASSGLDQLERRWIEEGLIHEMIKEEATQH